MSDTQNEFHTKRDRLITEIRAVVGRPEEGLLDVVEDWVRRARCAESGRLIDQLQLRIDQLEAMLQLERGKTYDAQQIVKRLKDAAKALLEAVKEVV